MKTEARSAEEWRVTVRTGADRYEEVEGFIPQHHTYEIPGIIALPVARGPDDYLKWVVEETRDRTT